MKIVNNNLNDSFLIQCTVFEDNRGLFIKNFEKNFYDDVLSDAVVSETFYSKSNKNVLRGMHFQLKNPQGKLITVLNGRILDVIIDLRRNSSTYKKWQGFNLNSLNGESLYVPPGFAHGFLSLEDNTIVMYECFGRYDKQTDSGIIWNDETIGINWGKTTNLIISEKDSHLPNFCEGITDFE